MARGTNPLAGGSLRARRDDEARTVTVADALASAKGAVKGLGTLVVTGEVTGFRGPNARSGHCYFQVKDESAAMDVIVWRSTYARLGFTLKDGLMLELTGSFDVYAGSGRLSFVCTSLTVAGEGMLRQQVEALAKKLAAEGLMDDARKRRPPRFCQRVAVVTSLSGSVIDDVRRTLRRRNPLVALDLVGCTVQGTGAVPTIIYALEVAASYRPEAILLVRGGGSFEDLMTFNDEALARAIATSPVPVITGIGHEPDVTIADMVADRRCSTPTAAAESVAPAIDEVVQVIEGRRQRMAAALSTLAARERQMTEAAASRAQVAISARLEHEAALLEALSRRRCLEDPFAFVYERLETLEQDAQRLHDAMPRVLDQKARDLTVEGERLTVAGRTLTVPHAHETARLASALTARGERLLQEPTSLVSELAAALEALSPLSVLARGYAIAQDSDGHVLTDAARLAVGQSVSVRLAHGTFAADITKLEES